MAVSVASPAGRSGALPVRSPRMLALVSDERLVALVRRQAGAAGSDAAFEAIYDRHHRGILSFCRHMLGDRQEAEDVVQHTFLGAYRDLISSEKPIALRAWLYAIARNRCLSTLRSRREQLHSDELDAFVPAVEGLAAEVQRRQELRDLLSDLARLPDDQRAALVLGELQAMNQSEIASVLGVRKDKVKALVFQARESLGASRRARDTPCADIREQLATVRGGALRRAELRRHLAGCGCCREFKAQVDHQRRAIAMILPVVPTLALKHGALPTGVAAGAAGAAAAGGAGTAGGLVGLAAKGALGKGLVALALVGGTTAGGIVAADALHRHRATSPVAPGGQAGATRSRGVTAARQDATAVPGAVSARRGQRAAVARDRGRRTVGVDRDRRARSSAAAATGGGAAANGVARRDHGASSQSSQGRGALQRAIGNRGGSSTGQAHRSGVNPRGNSGSSNRGGSSTGQARRSSTSHASGRAPSGLGRANAQSKQARRPASPKSRGSASRSAVGRRSK